MGYRSDVKTIIKKSDYERMKTELVENELFKYATVKEVSKIDGVILEWRDVKWHEGYNEVAEIEKFITNLDVYKIIRIGEEIGDIEILENAGENDEYDFINTIDVVTYIEEYI